MSDDKERIPHGAEIEDLVIARMRSQLTRPRWWRRPSTRIAFAGGAVLLAGASVAATILLDARPVTETQIVQCLDRASTNPDGSLPGTAVSLAAPTGVVSIEDAVAVCRDLWKAGGFNGNEPLDPTPSPGTVPDDFTTCVTDSGIAAVVPGLVECTDLRLHPYQPNVPTGR